MEPCPHRLLVVDDNDDDYLAFCLNLRRAQLKLSIDRATSGAEAIQYLQECLSGLRGWPFVMFLDIKMGVVGGFEVLAWARQNDIPGHTVIAMMSMSSNPRDVRRAFLDGARAYVSKMANPNCLIELILSVTKFGTPQDAADGLEEISYLEDLRAR